MQQTKEEELWDELAWIVVRGQPWRNDSDNYPLHVEFNRSLSNVAYVTIMHNPYAPKWSVLGAISWELLIKINPEYTAIRMLYI